MTPEFAAFKARFGQATLAGLVAAAAHYQGALRPKLQRGYTSGAFVTGATASSVQMTAPYEGVNGPEIVVGTNELVAMYWELGHHNLFTRKYERVEYWRETLGLEGAAMAAAMGSTMRTVLESGATAAEGFDS